MRILLLAAVALLLAGPGAAAQVRPDPACSSTAWCLPDQGGADGFMEGWPAHFDAAENASTEYPCTGAGECLGTALVGLLCAADGRGSARATCSGMDGGGGEELKAGTLGLTLRGYNAEAFVAEVGRTRIGSRLRIDGPRAVEFTLQAKYSDAGEQPDRYLAVINTMAQGMQPTAMVVLVDRGRTRVVHHSVFPRLRGGR